jgi:DNA-binding response OmpR family regulator
VSGESSLPAVPPHESPGNPGKILIVDDEVFIRNALQLFFETMGFTVQAAGNGEEALRCFSKPDSPIDVVILDLVMPGIPGIDLLKLLKEKDPSVEVIIATGCGSMGSAIEALRFGAFDYITKPLVNFEKDILPVVREAVEERHRRTSGPPAEGVPPGPSEREKKELLDRIIRLAAAVNRPRSSETVLETVEDALRKDFSVRAGVVFQKGQSGQFTCIYSWGFSGPISPKSDHLPDQEPFVALREGNLAFFHAKVLDPSCLGIPPEDLIGSPGFACIPLLVQGGFWGGIVLFFSSDPCPESAGSGELHPFQVLVPILSTSFAGALKYARTV